MTELPYGQAVTRELDAAMASGANGPRWEPFTDAFIAAVKTARVVVDVGAEYGFYVRLALKHGPLGVQVIAFEPEQERAAALRDMFGRIPGVRVDARACASGPGVVEGVKPAAGYSLSFRGLLHHDGEAMTLETVALDDLVARADVVKIDVEGAEGLVLAGMTRLLAQDHPVLFLEVHPAQRPEDTEQRATMWQRLRDLGYQIGPGEQERLDFGGHVILQVPTCV